MAPPEEHADAMLFLSPLDADDLTFESAEYVSLDAYLRFVDARERRGDRNHYEFLNGRVVMTPPAGYPHSRIETRISSAVDGFVVKRKLGICFGSSGGFVFPSGDVVEPDLAFVSNQRWAALPTPIPEGFMHVVPDLLVEILSPRTASRDRGEKRAIYELNGVREYWLIDHRREIATILFLGKNDAYGEPTVVESGEKIVSRVLKGLRVPLLEILER